jgi:hypothetical protein
VHAAKIVAAVLDVDTGEVKSFVLKGDVLAAAGFCAGLPRPVRVAYEAGPTGYGLARASTLESGSTPHLAHPVMRFRPAHISRDTTSTTADALPPPNTKARNKRALLAVPG